jgi:hypothetical protein
MLEYPRGCHPASSMSWYITVRSDSSYRRSVDADRIVTFLRSLPELVQTGANTFAAAPGHPWVNITLALSNDGSYADLGVRIPTVNLVDIVCSYEHAQDGYDTLASRIAAFLDWEALDEHAERKIWP